MRNREMVGKEIWNRLLKAEDGTLRNLYLATYSLDQGVLWWIADTLSKKPAMHRGTPAYILCLRRSPVAPVETGCGRPSGWSAEVHVFLRADPKTVPP